MFFAIWESHKTGKAGLHLVGVYFGENRVGLVDVALLEDVAPKWRNLPLLGGGPS